MSTTRPSAVRTTDRGSRAGSVTFARYAYAPNELGYCGPGEHQALLAHAAGADGARDPAAVEQLAMRFEGVWHYLELIAAAAGAHPMDEAVQQAYWLGGPLVDRVDAPTMQRVLSARLRGPATAPGTVLGDGVPRAARPDHSFHVFAVYPWVRLLGSGRASDKAVSVLDRCRIRWGRVADIDGDQVAVRSQPLRWDGTALRLGPGRAEQVHRGLDGLRVAPELRPGDWVALHWEWICERLEPGPLRWLRRSTHRQLALTNARLGATARREVQG